MLKTRKNLRFLKMRLYGCCVHPQDIERRFATTKHHPAVDVEKHAVHPLNKSIKYLKTLRGLSEIS